MKTNNVLLIGYVGVDPTITSTKKGQKKALIRMATHMPKKNEKGGKTLDTVWHNVIAFDAAAAYAEQGFVKGSKILVDGRIDYRRYQDQTGQTRYITSIVADSVLNLDR